MKLLNLFFTFFVVVLLVGCDDNQLVDNKREVNCVVDKHQTFRDEIGFKVIETIPGKIHPYNEIKIIEIKKHQYLVITLVGIHNGQTKSIIHDPECKKCEEKYVKLNNK